MAHKPHKPSLRIRLLVYFMVIILIMSLLLVWSIQLTNEYNTMSKNSMLHMAKLQEITTQVNVMTQEIEHLIYLEDTTALKSYEQAYKIAKEAATYMQEVDPNSYHYRDISAVVNSLYGEGLNIFEQYNEGVSPFYLKGEYPTVQTLQDYLYELVHMGIDEELETFDAYSKAITVQTRNYTLIIYLLCGGTTLLCIFFAFKFSKTIAYPIHALSKKLFASGRWRFLHP